MLEIPGDRTELVAFLEKHFEEDILCRLLALDMQEAWGELGEMQVKPVHREKLQHILINNKYAQ